MGSVEVQILISFPFLKLIILGQSTSLSARNEVSKSCKRMELCAKCVRGLSLIVKAFIRSDRCFGNENDMASCQLDVRVKTTVS